MREMEIFLVVLFAALLSSVVLIWRPWRLPKDASIPEEDPRDGSPRLRRGPTRRSAILAAASLVALVRLGRRSERSSTRVADAKTEIAPRSSDLSRADDPPLRLILPLSSHLNVLPGDWAYVAASPMRTAFRPERVVINGEPGDWIIGDIRVGDHSQMADRPDPLPGDLFSAKAATDPPFFSFPVLQVGQDFAMRVKYVGPLLAGSPFVCGVLGTSAS